MKVVGRDRIQEFANLHADIKIPIYAWLKEAEEASWQTPADVKARYPTASFLSDNRVVFNIKGNRYRLEVKINYKNKIVLIKRMGTHADYSKWQ
jgi:mRNA interferase HigB